MTSRGNSSCDRARSTSSAAEVQACCEKKSTSKYITKHHSEKEWEGDACEQAWIDLFVCRHFILINNHLSNCSELTLSKISWNSQLCVNFALYCVHIETVSTRNLLRLFKEVVLVLCRDPNEANEKRARFKHVEGAVYDLILVQELLIYHDVRDIFFVLQWVVNIQVLNKLCPASPEKIASLLLSLLGHRHISANSANGCFVEITLKTVADATDDWANIH